MKVVVILDPCSLLLHLPASEAGPVPDSDIMRPTPLGLVAEAHNSVSILFVGREGKVGSASDCYFKTLQERTNIRANFFMRYKSINTFLYVILFPPETFDLCYRPDYRSLSMFQYYQIDPQQHWDISILL